MKQKVNTNLLAALRRCVRSKLIGFHCDRTIGTALVRRGLAVEDGSSLNNGHHYWITAAGRERAKLKADCVGQSCCNPDPSLLEDLPS
jgi:hypothetical protein